MFHIAVLSFGRCFFFTRINILCVKYTHIQTRHVPFSILSNQLIPFCPSFYLGDIIVGTESVDQNWWKGSCNGKIGIFPTTHVQELSIDSQSEGSSPAIPSQPSVPSPCIGGPSTVPAPASSNLSHALAIGRANIDLTAQLDDELGFQKGDIVTIIKVVDSDFCIGECKNKCGQFPVWAVDIIEGNLNTQLPPKQEKRKSKFRWWEENGSPEHNSNAPKPSNAQPSIPVQSPTISDPYMNSQNSPMPDTEQITENQSQNVRNHLENIKREFTSHHENNNVPFVKTHQRNSSYTLENTRSYDSSVTPYGRTLFPFIAENPNELTFFDNEIVMLVRYVDEQWMEGELNGVRGIFPISYIDVIVDCPHTEVSPSIPIANSTDPVQDTAEETSICLEEYAEDVYGRVLFDFKAESERDLDLREGDTVTLLRKLNENWFEALHDNGKIGLCPVSFVEIISSEPMSKSTIESPPSLAPRSSTSSQEPMNKISTADHHYANVPSTPHELSRSDTNLPAMTNSAEISTPSPKPMSAKPSLKPKPQLKPKPPLLKSTSVSGGDRKPTIMRKTASVDVDVKSKRQSMPVMSQSILPVLPDSSLDDLVQKELQSAQPQETLISPMDKTWSPTATMFGESVQFSKDSSSKKPVMQARNTSNTLSAAGQPTVINTPPSGQQARPVPSRPPPPPSGQSVKRKAPTRPTGPSVARAPSNVPLTPKPVPQRKAPPRPSQVPLRAASQSPRREAKTQLGGNLMDFSPTEKISMETAMEVGSNRGKWSLHVKLIA